MRRTRFNRWPCPIARASDLFDGWTPIVMREAFTGARRFEQFQQRLNVSRATLVQQLNKLVDEGLLEKTPYQEKPTRYEYHLTDKGHAFFDVLAAMWRFGEDWLFKRGYAPVLLTDRETETEVKPIVVDEHTGKRIDVRRLRLAMR